MWSKLIDILARVLSFNLIEQIGPSGQVILCNKLEETGKLYIKIRKGLIPYPPLYICLPIDSEIIEPYINEMIIKKEIYMNKNICKFFIDRNKIPHKNCEFEVIYRRKINKNDIDNIVRIEKHGDQIEVYNYSNKYLKRLQISVRELAPFTINDIPNYANNLEEFFKNYLEVIDENGNSVNILIKIYFKYFKNNIYPKDITKIEPKIEVEILWYADLNPNDVKRYKIYWNI